MGKYYRHLTIEERCEMARLHCARHTVRQISASVDRPPSTVAREMKRNGSQSGEYKPVYAEEQAQARRWRGSRLERDAELREQVLCRLKQGWSSPTRVYIDSSMRRWCGRRTTHGVTTCLVASGGGAGVGAGEAGPLPSSSSVAPWRNAPRKPMTGRPQAIGRRT